MTNVTDNLLWRKFAAPAPNLKWTSDITCIWVSDRWLYLATVMDLYSRYIVGWSLDMSMTEQTVSVDRLRGLPALKGLCAEHFNSITAAKSAIFEYIEVFYNQKRRHSALGYLSPVEYERRYA